MQTAHELNEENLQRINTYIENHPNCKIPKVHTVFLQGNNVDLLIFRLPIDHLLFNIKNGRFKAEYIELIKKEGRELKTEEKTDALKIQKLLINLDAKQSSILLDDLKKYGQREPGIITNDGYVINGNRRMALLKTLFDNGEDEYGFLQVARLPPHISPQDLWKIEAGIQLSRKVQLDYGPINTLLKIKEGIDTGLSPQQIAKSLYGGFTADEILENIEQLKLINKYTKFIGDEGNFKLAEGVNEHFIDLRSILSKAKKGGFHPEKLAAIEQIGFQLIHDGVPQRELRKIKNILRHEKVTEQFYNVLEFSKPEQKGEKIKKLKEAQTISQFTQSRTIFLECLDEVRAAEEAEEPIKLLKRAITNVENIDPDNPSLQNSESQDLIQRLYSLIEDLKNNSQES